MRVLLITAGSRGDVEPFAILARRLAAEGHSPRLVIPDESGIDGDGLEIASLGVNFRDMVDDVGVSPLSAARAFRERIRPAMVRVFETGVREVLETQPDVVVSHPKVLTAADAAAAVGAAHVLVQSVPTMIPTREFPAPGVVNINLGPFNRLTYGIAGAAKAMFRKDLEAATAPLQNRDLSPNRGGPTVSLVPISPVILPRPHDWPDAAHLTGAWNPPAETQSLDPALQRFVEGGSFVLAGFGSMVGGDAAARGQAIVAVARARGLRVLVVTGWGGISVTDDVRGDDVHVVGAVPHGAVLPLAAAAIHHGGAGTVHAAVRAGVPSVVVPFFGDQPFWGRQLHERGFGGQPVGRKRVTAERIGRSLDEALAQHDRVREASVKLRSEDGTGIAAEVLERLASGGAA